MSAQKTITMKKGSSVINVAVNRQKHYESLGYKAPKPETASAKKKAAADEKPAGDA